MEKYPDTVRTLDHCFYVDDLVTGEDDAKSAFDLSSKAAKILSEAGMNLRKWISNDCELMKQWQLEHFDHLNMNDFVNHPHRVLGLLWHPQKDYLSLRLTSLLDFLQKRKNTKRFLLMAAGRIFDPLGFASPFTIRFKILFQEIWQRKTDWDEELLPDIREKFEQWCSEASFLCELQIPRYALQCDSVNCPECEIHTFSDASIKAYGAVSYVRLRTFDKISVHLLASKSRVAPLKVLTLPRLELMGALLAARLAKEISRVLNEKISTTNYFWTDSTIALSWIQGPSNRWKVFVANRVKEIRSLTDKDSWRHCAGKDNPSDLLTRGISADSLINCEKWWKGPSFLQEGNTVPVSNNVLLSDESAYLEELKPTERKTLTVILDNNLLNHILSVSNNFQKNLCIFSYIYRFINNCKRPSNKQIGPLRMCEIQRAEITLVRGKSERIFSDNATNFVGTQLELKRLREIMSNCVSNLSKFLCEERVEWSFIPPRAPNHGGLWEAGVKAVKYHLRRVMGDFDALPPGHFLVGRPITAIAEPSLTEVSDNRLKVWQKQTKIVQHIWKRWSNNYLSTLQNRNKWYFEKNNVKIHDMVILKEDNLPVCNWPLGRILEVYHGKDNKIRVVLVKTKNGIFKRPITKLCILPFSSE
ncbi:integrase catalytic domain-containing protein [Trichonephila clavipes]|nr:integrase catalytic domain-containing protein [Trichonephila clavipes]